MYGPTDKRIDRPMDQRTDKLTNRPTDGRTHEPSLIDARTHLKRCFATQWLEITVTKSMLWFDRPIVPIILT